MFPLAYEIDKCWIFGQEFTEAKRNTVRNNIWKDVICSIIELRKEIRPKNDLDFLSWPLWYDQNINLPLIKKLQRKSVDTVKRNTVRNNFWKDVICSIIELRKEIRPKNDLDFLSWPLWYDQNINLPLIKKLQRKSVDMVSDILGISWEIMTKEEIERTKGITLNFLEYMAINHSVTRFISSADNAPVN